MPGSIWYAIAETPWWLYVACVYALWVSYLATKPRSFSVKNLYVMPAFFIGMSLMCMCALLKSVTYQELGMWMAMYLLGTGVGFLQYTLAKIKAVKDEKAIYLPGSYLPLVMICCFFASKFYFGFTLGINYLSLIQPKHTLHIIALYGFLSGLFSGRLGYGLRCLRNGPYQVFAPSPQTSA